MADEYDYEEGEGPSGGKRSAQANVEGLGKRQTKIPLRYAEGTEFDPEEYGVSNDEESDDDSVISSMYGVSDEDLTINPWPYYYFIKKKYKFAQFDKELKMAFKQSMRRANPDTWAFLALYYMARNPWDKRGSKMIEISFIVQALLPLFLLVYPRELIYVEMEDKKFYGYILYTILQSLFGSYVGEAEREIRYNRTILPMLKDIDEGIRKRSLELKDNIARSKKRFPVISNMPNGIMQWFFRFHHEDGKINLGVRNKYEHQMTDIIHQQVFWVIRRMAGLVSEEEFKKYFENTVPKMMLAETTEVAICRHCGLRVKQV